MSAQAPTAAGIEPFTVEVREEQIDDLHRRIAATRWPTRSSSTTLAGRAARAVQGARALLGGGLRLRRIEARLNALPQFTTEIDGLDIHFIHVNSQHDDALPLIITHGWPGSVIEMLEAIGPLTDPTAHGGDAEDAFDLVIPSIPGYGFSEPTEAGWDSARIGEAGPS